MTYYIIFIVIILLFLSTIFKDPFIKIKKQRVVCSLTTRPNRPYYFEKVLDSLLNQFDAVYLALPYVSCKGEKYDDYTYKDVKVVRTNDYGPTTKFFGALDNEEDNTIIVAIDDDIIYDKNLRNMFEQNHSVYPNDVLSGAGIVYKYYSFLNHNLSITGRRPGFPFFLPSILGINTKTYTVAGYSGISFKKNY